MKKKRMILSVLLIVAMVFTFAACSGSGGDSSGSGSTATSSAPAATSGSGSATTGGDASELNIQVIAKGFQHQFWQVVKQGAEQAATDLGVGKMDFNGPEGESAINTQIDMINAALAQNPSAIALAALDTSAVMGQLEDAQSKNIPIIGFDSGVPDAPEGAIAATASTDNEAAAAIAAEKMMADPEFKGKIDAATADKPIVIAVLSQDATSASIIGRTKGFLDAFKAAVEAIHPGAVEITGHEAYAAPATEKAAVNILVQVPPTPDAADMKNGAQSILAEKNLIGIFLSNEGAVTGLLNATNDGADLAKSDVVVAGFDAGATQKKAVKDGLFLGSVTQDPYQIGYKAVELAVQAALGETVADVDTGAKWYDASNMDDADIKDLIYD